MKPSQVAKSIETLYQKRRPFFLWGPPGAGKSAVVKQACERQGVELIDIRLSMLDPTDLKGFPIADHAKQVMRWLTADFLPQDKKWKGLIFFDEANAASKLVEAPMYQLTLDRRLGDYHLPDGASIGMAGNRETDRAIANRMSSALQNRLIHIEYEVNLDDWIDWGLSAEKKIATEMVAFMRFRPGMLHHFDPNSKAWPSPRSWMFANELTHSGLDHDTEFELLKGTVGEGAAGEFAAFMNVWRELPSVESVLKDPKKTRVPTGPDALYAISTALAEHATKKNFDVLMEFIERLDPEYQVVFVRDTVRRKAPIEETKSFIRWATKHAETLA